MKTTALRHRVGSLLIVTPSVALSLFVVVGLNVTEIAHDELPLIDVPQVLAVTLKSGAFAPLIALPIESG